MGFDAALSLVGRNVRRRLRVVVDAARDDWSVGIALEEIDDDLLPNAGNMHSTPVLAGPRASDSHPARAVLILFAHAVPRELHLDATVIVHPDLLPGVPYDKRRLGALNRRLAGRAEWSERHAMRNRHERVVVGRRRVSSEIAPTARRVAHVQELVGLVGLLVVVFLQVESEAALERVTRALAADDMSPRLLSFDQ